MSKIALSPNASGTGTFTIASPNSNTNSTLTLPEGTATLATERSGSIVQIQHTQFTSTNTYSIDASSDAVITDLEVTITPVYSDSIMMLDAYVYGEASDTSFTHDAVWFFYKSVGGGADTKLAHPTAGSRNVGVGSMAISYQQQSANTPDHVIYRYFDTVSSTSSHTYKVGVGNGRAGAVTWYLNQIVSTSDARTSERMVSNITVTEIKA